MRNSTIALSIAFIAGLADIGTIASAQAPNAGITIKKVNDHIYFAEGGGGNSSIIIGPSGVIVVDAKTTVPAAKSVIDEVAKITNKPITTVILTHSDGDHVFGLPAFPKGITIIAHENDKKELAEMAAAGERRVPPAEYQPNKIVTGRETDTISGVRMTLIHVANAHTSGDLAVYLPDDKVVIAGDLLGVRDPGVHPLKNGNSEGWIKFVSELVKLDANTFVRGHADPATKAEVQALLKNAEDKRAKIVTLVRQGKTLDEVKQAFGEELKPATPPQFPTFTETTYDELKK